MPAAARLSLEQIASIQAELDVDPARSQAVFASNGIDAREYENQMRELEARLRANAHEAERFEQLRGYYRAILGPRH